MNTAKYVDEQIPLLKSSGIPLSEAAWKAALLCVGWPYIFGDRGEYCTAAKRKAVYSKHPAQETLITKCQVLKGTVSDCGGCQWYPKGQRVRSFDCRGFTYWILLQVYGWKLMGTGATKQWNTESNWKKKGLVSEGIPENTLVCLFYPEKKNPKVMAHTGFGLNGETVECSNGVQHFRKMDKKWTHWAVPACVEGEIPTPTPPAPDPDPDPGEDRPALKKGSSGTYVTLLQGLLIQRGYELPKYGADGKFGNETLTAVQDFQRDHGLAADGIVGKATWEALEGAEPTKHYTVIVPHLTLAQAEALIIQYPEAMKTEEG